VVEPPVQLDVLTIGRVGIDLYPFLDGVTLDRVDSFGRYLGGSAANVAVAAARLGHSAALITRTGSDPFARFVRDELVRLGVRADYVLDVPGRRTTIAFCEILPPDNFPLYYWRDSPSPELLIEPRELDLAAVEQAGVYWSTLSGISAEPARAAHYAAWRTRNRRPFTVLDLDYRPSFWASERAAGLEGRRALEQVSVAVGNLQECQIVVGESEPEKAADALIAAGVELAVVKMGSAGVMARTRDRQAVAAPVRVEVVNGLGAGDAFGGALCHGLLTGMGLEEMLGFAGAAGALVAGRRECATAMPTLAEIEDLLGRRPGSRRCGGGDA
jgi:5-dehydro-2-deoxygluconokinase